MKVVPGFEHVPGVSCGPTSVRDVLAAQGLNLTEAMVFGLGAGLGFGLVRNAGLSRNFFGRTLELERDCVERLGLEWREVREPDAARAWQRVRARVDEGRAVILTTDIKDLPYYGVNAPFNGHRVALVGYDDAREVALVADTERPGFIEVNLAALAKARASDAPFWGQHDNSWFEIHGAPRAPVAELVPDAIRATGASMLDATGLNGLAGLRAFADDLRGWPKLSDFARVAKEGYYAVEKRGTGGGFFRPLFAQFLDEAKALRPDLALGRAAHDYRELAWAWGELATALKLAAKDGAWDGLPQHAAHLADREAELAEQLAAVK